MSCGKRRVAPVAIAIGTLFVLGGCGSDDSPPVAPRYHPACGEALIKLARIVERQERARARHDVERLTDGVKAVAGVLDGLASDIRKVRRPARRRRVIVTLRRDLGAEADELRRLAGAIARGDRTAISRHRARLDLLAERVRSGAERARLGGCGELQGF